MFRLTRGRGYLCHLYSRVRYEMMVILLLERIESAKSVRGSRPIVAPSSSWCSPFSGEESVLALLLIVQQREYSTGSPILPFRRGRLIRAYYSAYVRGKIFAWSNRLVKSCAISQIDRSVVSPHGNLRTPLSSIPRRTCASPFCATTSPLPLLARNSSGEGETKFSSREEEEEEGEESSEWRHTSSFESSH